MGKRQIVLITDIDLQIETLQLIRKINSSEWNASLSKFLTYHAKLVDIYASKKKMTMMPVKINGDDFNFSVGKHNERC